MRKAIRQSRPVCYTVWSLEAVFMLLFWAVARLLPVEPASAMGRWFGRKVVARLGDSRYMRANYRVAFPEAGEAEITRLIRKSWGNLWAVLAEFPHLGKICDRSSPNPRVEIENHAYLEELDRTERAAVFFTAHMGNWEILGGLMPAMGRPLTVVYTPQGNPLVDAMVQYWRQRQGMKLVEKHGGIRILLRRLGAGESIGLLVDQRVDEGEHVPFFDRSAKTTTAPARLALRTRNDLVPVRVMRVATARYRVVIHPPVSPPPEDMGTDNRALEMTREVNGIFERWIREEPGEWLCLKRRWAKPGKELKEKRKKKRRAA
ncbi:lysophospholipid acyltransferase family protein [Fodinicurvata sediminis]|uniref:lysophospholipid acyltransferase family protein n=1 Tax=Fodinicurvata sediminis TaxID=1121832 RepID=UPI0003B4D23E|nr:lauroyl acyltransferase [Fodinicurvata sediminis]